MFLLGLLFAAAAAADAPVCFASFGGTHLTIAVPLIAELRRRGVPVRVFVAAKHEASAGRAVGSLGAQVVRGHGGDGDKPEDMPDAVVWLHWAAPRLLDALAMKPMVLSVISAFVKEAPLEVARRNLPGCGALVCDPFQYLYADAAAGEDLLLRWCARD